MLTGVGLTLLKKGKLGGGEVIALVIALGVGGGVILLGVPGVGGKSALLGVLGGVDAILLVVKSEFTNASKAILQA